VAVDGVHLTMGGVPHRVRGATYGSFLARRDGEPFPDRAVVQRDFAAMADAGLNTVRTYTLPPVDVFEAAADHELRMLVGLYYADWRMATAPGRSVQRRIRDAGRRAVDEMLEVCRGNPTVLGIAVGNEVPVDLVRLHGQRAITDVLADLTARIHEADPDLPVTYVNFPTSEFLDVEGQDLVSFNVFLERPEALRGYLRHLLVLARDRPLLITELGLAGDVHGAAVQAETLDWQLGIVDETGCAGATVFSWTDEWGVGGQPVTGWGFGLTDAARVPKPALDVVRRWAAQPLVGTRPEWPSVSVVVCAYNEERTLPGCLESLAHCEYPGLEVIVCDDGSTDGTAAVVERTPFRLLRLPHGGLSRARNAGLAAATGEIVAYLDADAACHPEWPFHLVRSLDGQNVAATGGPNLPFPTSSLVERAVALSPGGPVEVLVTDDRAEHVPGCNMAFRREELVAIGGFDEAYTAAGDDVDVCWKLLDRGRDIAYAPTAQVRHHRRGTLRGYLRQQRGYGRAERMLSGAHRHRFNRLGQARWSGCMYGAAPLLPRLLRPVVYHGYLGMAPYQPVVRRRAETATVWVGALLPLSITLAVVGVLLASISPWWFLLTAAAVAVPVAYAGAIAASVRPSRHEPRPVALALLVGALHALQPFARIWGRLRGRPLPANAPVAEWSGERVPWLHQLTRRLGAQGCSVRWAHPEQPWDLRVTVGPFVGARLTTAVLWHWQPAYSLTLRVRPLVWGIGVLGIGLAAAGMVAALVALPAIAVVTLGEALVLRARVRRAVLDTAAEAISDSRAEPTRRRRPPEVRSAIAMEEDVADAAASESRAGA
jgi:glycosyltransferase involved in cell wall biosynthesis